MKIPMHPYSTLLALATLLVFPTSGFADDTKISTNDERFLQREAVAGAAEVAMAELAVKKALRVDVKAYAETLVADHTKANTELAALAQKKGIVLTGDTAEKHADKVRELQDASGNAFDELFLKHAIADHKKCIESFEKTSTAADDKEVKAFASKNLPTLKAHLKKAEELASGPLPAAAPAKTSPSIQETSRQ